MPWQGLRQTRHAAISCGNHFFAYKVKANDSWALAFTEVTTHGVTNLLAEAIKIVRLSKEGCS